MYDLLSKLTPEQAHEVVMRLRDEGGAIRNAVLAAARNVLSEIDLEQVADDVFFVLDSLDVHDCWNRAGKSRDGYTAPDEAAVELIEEQLRPFFDQVERYHELGMTEEEATYCRGVMLGIYRYEHESKSEFREWSVDIPIECAGQLLTRWREQGQSRASNTTMDAYIRDCFPNWVGYFLRTPGAELRMQEHSGRKRSTKTDIEFAAPRPARGSCTARQGQYLAFIYYYTKMHGRSPSEADLQGYFRISAPSVHQMMVNLEKLGFIQRTPRQARSLKLLLPREQLPDLI